MGAVTSICDYKVPVTKEDKAYANLVDTFNKFDKNSDGTILAKDLGKN